MKKAKIVVHCLVQNEGRFIWYALTSILPFVDKIMVTDMSSIDGSEEIIKTIKSSKIEFKKVPPGTPDGLTKERQKMIDETLPEYTWVMVLDGDEIWSEKSIKTVTDIARDNPNIESIVVRTHNLVGDIYHRLPESSGRYRLAGKVGHLTIRFMNRKLIKGLHVSRPHGTQGFFDKDDQLVQQRDPEKIKFIDVYYHHATHLPRSAERSGDLAVPKRKQKLKYELGETIPPNQIPEIFFAKNKPIIVPDVSAPASTLFWLKAGLLTIPRRIKRTFFPGKHGY